MTLPVSTRAALVLLAVLAVPAQAQITYFVDDDASATGADGLSWATAFPDLQDALVLATGVDQIWIARGTYTPHATGRTASFRIDGSQDGLHVYGGFRGNEGSLDERDLAAGHETVLSGDLLGDDAPGFVNVGENAYHVLYLDGFSAPITSATVVDGLTVSGGNADGADPDERGGGVFCARHTVAAAVCSPTIRNLTIENNRADERGGGFFAQGGGAGTTSPTLDRVTFIGNEARIGGAFFAAGGRGTTEPRITNAVFVDNRATTDGGAIYLLGNAFSTVRPVVSHATFVRNEAGASGGAVYVFTTSGVTELVFANVILRANTAATAGTESAGVSADTPVTIVHGLVPGGCPAVAVCTAVSGSNPTFASESDPAGDDGVHRTADDGLRINHSSPARDAGTPMPTGGLPLLDITGLVRSRVHGLPDLGAYEYLFSQTSTLRSANEENGGFFGSSISVVPDANGDGYDDIVVGAPGETTPFVTTRALLGRAYVFSGRTGARLRTLTPGTQIYSNFGVAVAGIGDITGDGKGDILVGASSADSRRGRVYAFAGAGSSTHWVTDIVSPTLEVDGDFGASLSRVSDVNGDGTDDFIVGAPGQSPGASPGRSGRAYVYGGVPVLRLFALSAPQQQFGAEFGNSVAGLPDVDGDGHGDVVVGAHKQTRPGGPGTSGRVFVFSGATGVLLHTLDSPSPRAGGGFGATVSGIPDADGDGTADIVVGATVEGDLGGRAHVFSGATGAFLHTLVSPDSSPGGLFGSSVSGVPDVDGDGRGDVLVGAEREGQSARGHVHVFSGATGAHLKTILSDTPEGGGAFGVAVAGLSDVDGDARGDIAVGARLEDPGSSPANSGRAYTFTGASTSKPSFTLDGPEGWRTLAIPESGVPLGGRAAGYLEPLYTAGYHGADRDQRNRRGTANVFLYDEPTGAFEPPRTDTSVGPGDGVWVYVFEDDDPHQAGLQGGFPKSLPSGLGTPVTGPHTFALSYTPGAPLPGINLVGNPYAEALVWGTDGWTLSDVSTTAYVWDPHYNGGDYRTWNGSTGSLMGGVIPAGQGFHLEATAAGASVVVTEAATLGRADILYGLTSSLAGGAASGKRGGGAHGLTFRLEGTIAGSPRQSDLFVSLKQEAALGFDATDGRRLGGVPGGDALRLSALVPDGHEGAGSALAIASVPSRLGGPVEIPLHAEALADGSPVDTEATLAWEATALPPGWTAHLRDRATGQVHDLTEAGQVGLTLDASDALTHTSADLPEAAKTRDPLAPPPVPQARPLRVAAHALSDARFTLVLKPDASASPAALAAEIGGIGPNPARGSASLAVTVAESGEVALSMYDALGRLVGESRQPLVAGTHRLAVPVGGLAPGAYVVRVETAAGTATRRLTVVR